MRAKREGQRVVKVAVRQKEQHAKSRRQSEETYLENQQRKKSL
jgi:hypothetical protein